MDGLPTVIPSPSLWLTVVLAAAAWAATISFVASLFLDPSIKGIDTLSMGAVVVVRRVAGAVRPSGVLLGWWLPSLFRLGRDRRGGRRPRGRPGLRAVHGQPIGTFVPASMMIRRSARSGRSGPV